jgi:hypothetical protein
MQTKQMSIFSTLASYFAPQQIADSAALQQFIESRSAYLVQKSITEYTQARAGMLFSTMMREPIFLAGYEKARWHSYPAAISMMTEMVEGTIREREETPTGSLDAGLLRLVEAILAQYPVPSGLGEEFWRDAAERVSRDLAQAALGPPKAVQNIPPFRVKEIFDALPLNDHLKQHDFPMFSNTIRFHLTELKVEFEEKASTRKLKALLLG